MHVSGISAEHGIYTVKEISYGDVEAFDWESGLYGSTLLDSSAYTANIEYSGSDAIITLSLPAFLAGHNSVTVIAGYANSPTLCSDYFEVSGNFRNSVATFEKGATADETVEADSKAAGCLQEAITVTLKNETKREFSKNRPTAPNNDPDTIAKYYKTYIEWNEKINKYLSSIGLTQTQIDNLCKENGCNRDSYRNGFNCNKEKLIWQRVGAQGKTTSKWKLAGDCICIDETYPDL